MGESRTFSANYESAQKAADRALATPDGIDIRFWVEKLGSLEACATASRSFQTNFASMRSRARKNALRGTEASGSAYNMARGPYDDLICTRRPLADGKGWVVMLTRGGLAFDELDIIDRSTGAPINEQILIDNKGSALIGKWMREKDLDDADCEWLDAHFPNWCDKAQDPRVIRAKRSGHVDLADLEDGDLGDFGE